MEQEIAASLQKGISTAGGPAPNGAATAAPPGAAPGGGAPPVDEFKDVPKQVKVQALKMRQEGKSDQEIKAFIMNNARRPGRVEQPQRPQRRQ